MVAERRTQEPRPITLGDLDPLERAIAELVRVAILERRRRRATMTVLEGGPRRER